MTKSQDCLIHCYNIKNQPSIYLSIQNNTCFGTDLYSAGTHHGNLLRSLVTEQGDLFYSTHPQGKLWPKLMNLKSRERIWRKKEKHEGKG